MSDRKTMVKIKYKNISPEMKKLADPNLGQSIRTSVGMEKHVSEYYFISIENLIPYKNQSRQIFKDTDLNELAETIKEHGVRQPLTVIRSEEEKGSYEIVSGERRFRAAQIAELQVLPCIIIKERESADEIAIIENIQRSDLHPIELGDAYYGILRSRPYGSVSELARKIGKPVSTVSELSSLAVLPKEIKSYLIENNIRSKSIFRKLLILKDEQKMRSYLGIDNSPKIIVPKNILRLNLGSEGFKIEAKGVNKLDDIQKENLINTLMDFIKSI